MITEHQHPVFSMFRGLVAGVRPSIPWLAGIGLPGIDVLDADGRSGWRIGCSRLHGELGRCEDELIGSERMAARALQRWLRYDAALETDRWHTPLVLIEHFASVALTVVDGQPMLRRDMFVEAWTRNLQTAWSSQCGESWRMPNRLSGRIAVIVGELTGDRTANDLTALLFELVCAAETSGGTSGGKLIGADFQPELATALRHTDATTVCVRTDRSTPREHLDLSRIGAPRCRPRQEGRPQ